MIGKSACSEWEDTDAEEIVALVLKYFSKQEDYPLTVVTQVVLTATQLFEVFQTDLLE